MDNINISEWVRSALVIDDKWGEVKDLIHTLNSNGISTSYYNPNPRQDIQLEDFGISISEDSIDDDEKSLAGQLKGFVRDSLTSLSLPELEPNSLTAYNLIFLDIDFGFAPAAGNVKNQAAYAAKLVADAISDQSAPYGIVLWSKESELPHEGPNGTGESTFDYISSMVYESASKKLKPLFIIDLEKSSFWNNNDYRKLADSLNEKLRANNLAKFFALWNKEVQLSTAVTCKNIQKSAESIANESGNSFEHEFFSILKYATYQHFGFPRETEEVTTDILSRYSFCYMSAQLHDKLQSDFSQRNLSQVFDDPEDGIKKRLSGHGIQVKECCSTLCKILKQHELLLSAEAHAELKGKVKTITDKYEDTKLHHVVSGLNFISCFDNVNPSLKGLPGLIHCNSAKDSNSVYQFTHGEEIYLNITPPCDIAQGRKDTNIYLAGKIYAYPSYAKALESYLRREPERTYRTPPALYKEGNVHLVLYFDLKNILRTLDTSKTNEACFILKDSIFAEVMQKFGHHNSRMGARTFY